MLPCGAFLFGVGEFLADLVVRVFAEHEAERRCVGTPRTTIAGKIFGLMCGEKKQPAPQSKTGMARQDCDSALRFAAASGIRRG